MTDDERQMLDEMRRREQKLKLELDDQESEMRAQQQLLREQEAERNRLAAEFEAMQQQVCGLVEPQKLLVHSKADVLAFQALSCFQQILRA